MDMVGNWTRVDEENKAALVDVIADVKDTTRRSPHWATAEDVSGPVNQTGCLRMRGGGLLELDYETCDNATVAQRPVCEFNGKKDCFRTTLCT